MKVLNTKATRKGCINFYTGSGKAKSGVSLPGLERRLRPPNIVQSDIRDVLRGVNVNMFTYREMRSVKIKFIIDL